MVIKTIIVSSELFWGFTMSICIQTHDSLKELCEYVKEQIEAQMKILNLVILKNKAAVLKLHCHKFSTLAEILESDDDIIYLCDHC
jgi:hypothetical protein